MSKIVYVFTNQAMPGYIKIGMTSRDDIKKRLAELSNPSGVPVPFECLYAAEVDDAEGVEKAIHVAFDCDRPNKKREFFTTEPHRIITLLKQYAKSDESAMVQKEFNSITSSEDKQAIDSAARENAKRRSGFTFSAVDIPEGAELVYTADEAKICKVVGDKTVEYEGQHYSLSGLATRFRRDAGYETKGVQGASYFRYEGELLSERRDRMEAAE